MFWPVRSQRRFRCKSEVQFCKVHLESKTLKCVERGGGGSDGVVTGWCDYQPVVSIGEDVYALKPKMRHDWCHVLCEGPRCHG